MSSFFVSLVDSSAAEASSSMSHHLKRVWSCPPTAAAVKEYFCKKNVEKSLT